MTNAHATISERKKRASGHTYIDTYRHTIKTNHCRLPANSVY